MLSLCGEYSGAAARTTVYFTPYSSGIRENQFFIGFQLIGPTHGLRFSSMGTDLIELTFLSPFPRPLSS